jgi:threonine/homoserine/homoserine lactone efflux protein
MPLQQLTVGRFLVLSLTFVVCTFVSHLSYVVVAATAGSRFLEGHGMVRFKQSVGLLFIGMGAALLAAVRS